MTELVVDDDVLVHGAPGPAKAENSVDLPLLVRPVNETPVRKSSSRLLATALILSPVATSFVSGWSSAGGLQKGYCGGQRDLLLLNT